MNKRIVKSGVKFLLRHKLQSFFMILGVVIGVIFLCLTFAAGLGTVDRMTSQIKSSFGSNTTFIMAGKGMQMGGPRAEGPITTLKIADLEALLDAVPGLLAYDPIQALPECEIISGDKNVSTSVVGRSAKGEVIWNRMVTSGEFITKEDEKSAERVALIGTKISKQLFGEVDPVGAQIRIGSVPFTVKGVLEEKGTDPHGNDLDMEVIVPITTLMSRLMNVDYVSGAKLDVDESKMTEIEEQITTLLKERHSVNADETDDFYVMTSVQVKNMIQKMNKVFSVYLPVISGVILLLGGIIISILMLISVSRRFSEIGLRKAVGASSKDLRLQFLTEAVLISLTGGIIGLILGIAITSMIFSMMRFALVIPWQSVVFGVLIPVVIGILAGIIPARKAANLDPVIALS